MDNLDNLDTWLKDWVNLIDSQNQCPYAKPVFESNKAKVIKLRDIDNAYDFWIEVSNAAENFNDDYEVIIVAMNTDLEILTEVQLLGGSDSLNASLNARNKDVWALVLLSDIYTMILLQRISKIDDASKVLEKKGQYNNYHPYRYNKDVIVRRKMRENLR